MIGQSSWTQDRAEFPRSLQETGKCMEIKLYARLSSVISDTIWAAFPRSLKARREKISHVAQRFYLCSFRAGRQELASKSVLL